MHFPPDDQGIHDLPDDMDDEIDVSHHHYVEMNNLLAEYAAEYPEITRLYSIGKSVQDRDLWVMEISDNPGTHEPGK